MKLGWKTSNMTPTDLNGQVLPGSQSSAFRLAHTRQLKDLRQSHPRLTYKRIPKNQTTLAKWLELHSRSTNLKEKAWQETKSTCTYDSQHIQEHYIYKQHSDAHTHTHTQQGCRLLKSSSLGLAACTVSDHTQVVYA